MFGINYFLHWKSNINENNLIFQIYQSLFCCLEIIQYQIELMFSVWKLEICIKIRGAVNEIVLENKTDFDEQIDDDHFENRIYCQTKIIIIDLKCIPGLQGLK